MRFLPSLFLISLVAACASPDVVDIKRVTDDNLSCEQIIAAIDEAKEFEAEARGERTVTGTNVAAAIFFWPGLAATYVNTEEAIDAAKDRQKHLEKIYETKNCSIGKDSETPIRKKLEELKGLFDSGLITKQEYESARKKAMGLNLY